ncbi:MAG: helix-turn-helix domain-containing protein [Candidatus Delongbacteria bacterium]|nr:helix-turn-helix domain-containing protein [Candidatus Delongbacteria bacterium]MBN2833383.1 helix-turn-helix domain-containing protein [Candidatus Delongbacteria bacterium]
MTNIDLKIKVVASAQKIGVVKTAELFGVNRKTVSKWLKNFNNNGTVGLENRSRKSQYHPNKIEEANFLEAKKLYEEGGYSFTEILNKTNLTCSLKTLIKKLRSIDNLTTRVNDNINDKLIIPYVMGNGVLIELVNRSNELTTFYHLEKSELSLWIKFFDIILKSKNKSSSIHLYNCKITNYLVRSKDITNLFSIHKVNLLINYDREKRTLKQSDLIDLKRIYEIQIINNFSKIEKEINKNYYDYFFTSNEIQKE